MIQVRLTPAMGKRLIGKGMVVHPAIQRVLAEGTLAIIAGSTNGYVAEEILASLGLADQFSRVGFRRGLTVPPGAAAPAMDFPGDVVIRKGELLEEKSIFGIADKLGGGDVVMKGGNAYDANGHAAVQIGSDVGGTAMAAVSAVIGRRAQLIVPIGLEKRVFGDVHDLALVCNATDGRGSRPIAPARHHFQRDRRHQAVDRRRCHHDRGRRGLRSRGQFLAGHQRHGRASAGRGRSDRLGRR